MIDRRDRLHAAGEWLTAARKEAGLSQAQLGERLGVSGANVSNYERGVISFPDERTRDLSKALGVDELDVRRGLGLYVPGDEASADIDVPTAILRDRLLLPEARQHLLNQYKLLLRVQAADGPTDKAETPDAEVLQLPRVARKRTPRKRQT